MTFFVAPVPAPIVFPAGTRTERSVYTGTACLALMDAEVTGDVWEDLLYDGVAHDHGAGALMLNSASVGTHLEHDGHFPVEVVTDAAGAVLAFRVNLDPYAEDLFEVRRLDFHGDGDEGHEHSHSHGSGHVHAHVHGHDQSHGHADEVHGHTAGHDDGSGHGDGWSSPETIRLISASAVFGDPAGLPEADDTGDLIEMTFPAAAGKLTLTVYTDHGLRREIRATWTQ